MACLDDLLFSLTRYFYESDQFRCKDLSGRTEWVSGKLTELFPDLRTGRDGKPHIYPLRQYDVERMPLPCVGIACELNDTPVASFASGGALYRHYGRILVVGTDDRDREYDYDDGVKRTIQLQNALTYHFTRRSASGHPITVRIPWLAATYRADANGQPVYREVGTLRADHWQVVPVDENRFVGSFILELVE